MTRIASASRTVLALCLLTLVTLLAGCKGCQQQEPEKLTKEELEKKKQAERSALIVRDMRSLPLDSQMSLISAKPGHWHEAIQQFKATREDMQVMLASSVYYGKDPANIPATNFTNEYSRRNLFLPKGQEKTVNLRIYIPPTTKSRDVILDFDPLASTTNSTLLRISSELRAQPLMNPIPNSEKGHGARELKPYTSHFVVLSPQPLVYQYLDGLDVVRWFKSEEEMEDKRILSYELKLVGSKDFLAQSNQTTLKNDQDSKLIAGQITDQYSMPHSFLTMTSINAILWDDIGADDLSDDQQKAIVDWVHWGGQLIISGPTSWTRLQGSFLTPYLPVATGQTTELKTEDFAELSKSWEVPDLSQGNTLRGIEVIDRPLSGLKFNLKESGEWMPGTGELVAESQVGRGRIVITSFSLRETAIRNWPYVSSFYSTGLLRRPARQIATVRRDITGQKHLWSGEFRNRETDPVLHSNIRLLSRDIVGPRNLANPTPTSKASYGSESNKPLEVVESEKDSVASSKDSSLPKYTLASAPSYEPDGWGGAGAWNDFSGVAQASIQSLRAAAGIELPSRSTILKLLGGYLLCLVPLNWLVFRLSGRLEYAWLAAPIMAIIGVIVVGKVARLDIGFARRTTELAVLEIHGKYNRAHLTQYVALYTSLSTNYAIEFPETDSVALPMGDVQRVMRRSQNVSRDLSTKYGESDGVILEPLTVYSNSTEMLHSEQMLDLKTPIQLTSDGSGGHSLTNGQDFAIQGSLLIRRVGSRLETAWIGYLEPGQSKDFVWTETTPDRAFDRWSNEVKTQQHQPAEDQLSSIDGIWVGGLLHQIGSATPLVDGQIRLLGFTENPLGALKISPSQDQYDRACVVVAHLTPAKLGSITPDKNISSRRAKMDLDRLLQEPIQGLDQLPTDQDPSQLDPSTQAPTDPSQLDPNIQNPTDPTTDSTIPRAQSSF